MRYLLIALLAISTPFAGEADALFQAAKKTFTDQKSTVNDYTRAAESLIKAAQMEHVEALWNTAYAYEMGYFGKVDFNLANLYRIVWYLKVHPTSATNYFRAALGALGDWKQIPSDVEFVSSGQNIFAWDQLGKISDEARREILYIPYSKRKVVAYGAAATLYFQNCLRELCKEPVWSKEERAMAEKSMSMLSLMSTTLLTVGESEGEPLMYSRWQDGYTEPTSFPIIAHLVALHGIEPSKLWAQKIANTLSLTNLTVQHFKLTP